jgi:5'-3' exonuclease
MNTYIFSKFIIMGIPSYFSYIIKNYPNIIRNLQHFINNDSVVLNNLFMDCNSIIYDAVRSIEKESPNLSTSDFENAHWLG